MTIFEKTMSELLLRAIPDPLIWGLILIAIFLMLIFKGRLPAPASFFILILLSYNINLALGQWFYLLNLVMIVIVGAISVKAYFKVSGR